MDFALWFRLAPMWLLGPIILGALGPFAVLGWSVRRWQTARSTAASDSEESGREGYLVSAVLGLFALLLGFTFALAVDRYDTRRLLVVQEANAIGTTYLRAQLLEPPHRERISKLLVEYTDNRLVLAKAPTAELIASNDKLVTGLWQAAVAAFPSVRDYDFSSAFLDSVNRVIELDEARKAARRAHVPSEVFLVLAIYGTCTAFVLGYVLTGWRGRVAATFVLALFTLSFILIIDIDVATTGGIRESQEPIERLRASLSAWSPQIFDALPE
jgi:hypothetical protein